MSKETHSISNHVDQLAESSRALVAATADVAEVKVSEARKRLAAALETGKEIYGSARKQAIEGAKVADQTVRENPYQAIAIGLGVGVLLGFLVARRCSGSRD